MATILETYERRHPSSAKIHREALQAFPSGITHDIRHTPPFPVFVERADGSRKWDVDGNEIIDYVMGHGALFLGHSHPAIVDAVCEQAAKGTHYGAGHELELSWAHMVRMLIPSAEKVRFTSSGTEAVMMAIRLARASTKRENILKFDFHFHGWHDAVVGTRFSEQYGPRSSGIPTEIQNNTISIPANDLRLVEEALASQDVGAVILEPTGASWGTAPLVPGFLAGLRELTIRHGTLLIFDEVITGFRVARGGAQERSGVLPDLTCLAKILGGGLPGGAVVGKAEVLNVMEFRDEPGWNSTFRVSHPGTFNGNPLSAAAGSTMLSLLSDGSLHARADGLTEALVREMNEVLKVQRTAGCVYGLSSYFHIVAGQDCPQPDGVEWSAPDGRQPPQMRPIVALALKRAMLNHGVDLMGMSGGFVSAAHGEEDIERTVAAFGEAVVEMRSEGLV
jgi:glutamate-1-semialdehyde 2,1-aminomutase